MSIVLRRAKFFEAGEYPEKGISVTEADLDKIAANFKKSAEVGLNIEHTPSQLDKALGKVVDMYREGKNLMGKIGFSSSFWTLMQEAGAKKLSVELHKPTMTITKVSIVGRPRVASATVFSHDDKIVAFGELDYDAEDKANVDLISFYDGGIIIEQDGKTYRREFSVSDNAVVLKDPTEVRQGWIDFNSKQRDPRDSGDSTVELTKEQIEQITASAAQSAAKSAAEAVVTKFSEELDKKLDERDKIREEKETRQHFAETKIKEWKEANKIVDETVVFATAILVKGGDEAEAFVKFMDQAKSMGDPNKKPEDDKSNGDKSVAHFNNDDARKFLDSVGVTVDQIKAVKEGKDLEEVK